MTCPACRIRWPLVGNRHIGYGGVDYQCRNWKPPPEPRVTPLGGGWEITYAGQSLGIFDQRQAMGIARRISDGTLHPEDVDALREKPITRWRK